MKKSFLLIVCSLILVSCDSSTKNEAIKISSLKTEDSKNTTQESDVFECIPPIMEGVESDHYPENFLIMRALDDSDDSEPFIYASGQNANGGFQIVYYKDYNTFEIYINSEWVATQIVYNNSNYITSEGISVGSGKMDVISAYKKYGIEEYNLSKITQFGLDSLDIIFMGTVLADTFLYIGNDNIFEVTYTGIDYWGGLGAYIFILDNNDSVVKIISCSPTSG